MKTLIARQVAGALTLRKLADAKSVAATPLTPEGRPCSPAVRAERSGEDWVLRLGNPATTWRLVEVTR